VLRVLGNLLNLPGFDYESSEAVRAELVAACGARHGQAADTAYHGHWRVQGPLPGALAEAPIYQTDPVVRRAPALQQTRTAARPRAAY
jgi:NADH-quinone oxidoreductase subunit G